MNKSDTITAIAPALVKAQAEIKAALKDSTNPHFRSKYADLSSVVDAVKPALLKNGITYIQGVMDAENGVSVETMLLHTSGEWISSTLRIPASKQDAQGYGSAITYGRRYGLQSMCGVPAEDDDGNAAAKGVANERIEDKIHAAKVRPAAGAGDGLSKEEKERLARLASEIIDCFTAEEPETARDILDEANLDADSAVYLGTLLDSKQRNTLKRIGKERREAALKEQAPTQA